MERIAVELKVTRSCVCRALARVSDRVIAELKEKVERQKAQQTARLDFVIDQALQAWVRSQQDAVTITRKVEPLPPADDGTPRSAETVETETVGQCGEPSYLAEARAALADLRKLWGLDAPKQQRLDVGLDLGAALADLDQTDDQVPDPIEEAIAAAGCAPTAPAPPPADDPEVQRLEAELARLQAEEGTADE